MAIIPSVFASSCADPSGECNALYTLRRPSPAVMTRPQAVISQTQMTTAAARSQGPTVANMAFDSIVEGR